jgi:hypothetical protein
MEKDGRDLDERWAIRNGSAQMRVFMIVKLELGVAFGQWRRVKR